MLPSPLMLERKDTGPAGCCGVFDFEIPGSLQRKSNSHQPKPNFSPTQPVSGESLSYGIL